MSKYSIRPIAFCEGIRDSSLFSYRMNFGTPCKVTCYAWYIEGAPTKIMVDTGATAASFVKKGVPETDLTTLEDGLHKLGLEPDDIEIVIATHLHCDHVELARRYRKAKFIVQKRELDYARNPHPIDAISYERSFFDGIDFEVIDGDKEIIPGVSVLLTPGHTPGGQSVEVSTAAGRTIITGFCCLSSNFVQTNIMQQRHWDVATHLIHQDVRELYDTMLMIKRRADMIIALHEPSFAGKERLPEKP